MNRHKTITALKAGIRLAPCIILIQWSLDKATQTPQKNMCSFMPDKILLIKLFTNTRNKQQERERERGGGRAVANRMMQKRYTSTHKVNNMDCRMTGKRSKTLGKHFRMKMWACDKVRTQTKVQHCTYYNKPSSLLTQLAMLPVVPKRWSLCCDPRSKLFPVHPCAGPTWSTNSTDYFIHMWSLYIP